MTFCLLAAQAAGGCAGSVCRRGAVAAARDAAAVVSPRSAHGRALALARP